MEAQTTQAETTAPVAKIAIQQKDAVYSFLTAALIGTTVTVAQLKDKAVKTAEKKAVLKSARVQLFDGIKTGAIEYSKRDSKTDGELKKYCSSLINNWLKKDERFV